MPDIGRRVILLEYAMLLGIIVAAVWVYLAAT